MKPRCVSSRQGLLKVVGLLKGKLAKLEESGAYRKYFMHRTGHWLGMMCRRG
jgi:Xaa-Pro aminopeptidase